MAKCIIDSCAMQRLDQKVMCQWHWRLVPRKMRMQIGAALQRWPYSDSWPSIVETAKIVVLDRIQKRSVESA